MLCWRECRLIKGKKECVEKRSFMFNVKKIIKKISVCCVMAALVTGMLAGCGKKNENTAGAS